LFTLQGIENGLKPGQKILCTVKKDISEKKFSVICRIDTPVEVKYYEHGGILQYVLRQLLKSGAAKPVKI